MARKIDQATHDQLTLILNAQDPYQSLIGSDGVEKITYGVEPLASKKNQDQKVAILCPHCHQPFDLSHSQFQTIGFFECPSCGFSQADMDVVGQADKEKGDLSVKFDYGYKSFKVSNSFSYQIL